MEGWLVARGILDFDAFENLIEALFDPFSSIIKKKECPALRLRLRKIYIARRV